MWLADGPRRAACFLRARQPKRRSGDTWSRAGKRRSSGPRPPSIITHTLLPPIADFLRDVEAHAKSLGPRLEIPADVLDGTPESLDAVDKALKKIPWAKRQVPDLVTPLVAYLGEVMRKGSGGQWIDPGSTMRKRQVPVYDPAELAAWQEARAVGQEAFTAALEKPGGCSSAAASEASRKAVEATGVPRPEPIRFDVIEELISGPREVPIYDPAEMVAHDVARRRMQPIAVAAADKAAAEAKARGASEREVKVVWSMARNAAFQEVDATPKPIRIEVRKNNEPIDHHAPRGALPALRQRLPPDGRAQQAHPAALLARGALRPARSQTEAGGLSPWSGSALPLTRAGKVDVLGP